jgi:hypothetical protein
MVEKLRADVVQMETTRRRESIAMPMCLRLAAEKLGGGTAIFIGFSSGRSVFVHVVHVAGGRSEAFRDYFDGNRTERRNRHTPRYFNQDEE